MKKITSILLLLCLPLSVSANDMDAESSFQHEWTAPSSLMLAGTNDIDAESSFQHEWTAPSSLMLAGGEMEPTQSSDDDDDGDEDFLDDSDDMVEVSDPLETINRGMFWFNDKAYFYFLKPIARVYRVVPVPVRESVQNFFSNIDTPTRMVNSALQGKFKNAGNELVRLVVNTTVGVLGFFDPAKHWMDINKKDEDTGQTFGRWGIGTGPYLVLPILGPSNVRDGIGLIGDTALDPIYWELEHGEYYWTKFFKAVNEVSLDKDTYESIKKDNLDPYLFVRDAYMQLRAGKVAK